MYQARLTTFFSHNKRKSTKTTDQETTSLPQAKRLCPTPKGKELLDKEGDQEESNENRSKHNIEQVGSMLPIGKACRRLGMEFYAQDCVTLSKALLGQLLVRVCPDGCRLAPTTFFFFYFLLSLFSPGWRDELWKLRLTSVVRTKALTPIMAKKHRKTKACTCLLAQPMFTSSALPSPLCFYGRCGNPSHSLMKDLRGLPLPEYFLRGWRCSSACTRCGTYGGPQPHE